MGENITSLGSTGTISIEAIVQNGNVHVKFEDIEDLITIYFSGNPGTPVYFTIPFLDNPPVQSIMLDDNCTLCNPKFDDVVNNNILNYAIPSVKNNYDLAFGDVNVPNSQCGNADIDVKIVDINQNDKDWDINTLKVYVKYQVTSIEGSIDIDLNKTKLHLNHELKENYQGLYTGEKVKLYPNDSRSGIVGIEVKVLEGKEKQTIKNTQDLITIFFEGAPMTEVSFTFLYEDQYKSEINLCDNDTNSPDSHFCQPENDEGNTSYSVIRDFVFPGDVEIICEISNQSDGTDQGFCGVNTVPYQEGVTVEFYNLQPGGTTTYYKDITGGEKAVGGCDDESYYGKASSVFERESIGEIQIEPSVVMCEVNGVTTLDIVLIRMHMQGVKYFTKTYQYFAADVDEDTYIGLQDMGKIIDNILGISTDLVFDFIPAKNFEKEEENTDNTRIRVNNNIEDYDQFIQLTQSEILSGYNNVKFYGFKEGDVNNSCDNCDLGDCSVDSGGGESEGRNVDIVVNEITEIDDTFIVDVVSDTKDSLDIVGLTISVEPKGIELDTLVTFDSYEAGPTYRYDKNAGILKIIWQNKNAFTSVVSSSNKLFSIKFKKGNYNINDLNLSISDNAGPHYSVISEKAYYTNFIFNMVPVQKSTNTIELNKKRAVFSITPTVFDNKIVLNYFNNKSFSNNFGSFRLFNIMGQLIYQKEYISLQSNNNIPLELGDVPSGILFYQFKIGKEIYSGKLVKEN